MYKGVGKVLQQLRTVYVLYICLLKEFGWEGTSQVDGWKYRIKEKSTRL